MLRVPLEVKNVGSEDAPAFGVLEIVKFDADKGWIEVQKPTQDSYQLVLINGKNTLFKDSLGQGYSPFDIPPHLIRYNTAASPALGDDWGTVAGQWYLQKDKLGFQPWEATGDLPTGTAAFQLKVCSPPA